MANWTKANCGGDQQRSSELTCGGGHTHHPCLRRAHLSTDTPVLSPSCTPLPPEVFVWGLFSQLHLHLDTYSKKKKKKKGSFSFSVDQGHCVHHERPSSLVSAIAVIQQQTACLAAVPQRTRRMDGGCRLHSDSLLPEASASGSATFTAA